MNVKPPTPSFVTFVKVSETLFWLTNEQVMTAPGSTLAAGTVAFPETAEFESAHVTGEEVTVQPVAPVSATVVEVEVLNRMTGAPVTEVPAVVVVIVELLATADQGVLAVFNTLLRSKPNDPTPPLEVFLTVN